MTDPSSIARSQTEDLVRRYYRIVSDLSSSEDDLRRLLSPDLTVIEHPNALIPSGARRDLSETLEGFRRGKALLRQQEFTVHEVIADGDRAAAQVTWRGVVAATAGPFHEGQEIVAHVAALLTVRDGMVVRHETFDCYEPFADTTPS